MDAIILKCDKCKRHARVEWNLPGFEIKPGPGDRGYSFRCSDCNVGKQHFEHTEKTWLDITLTCLYNLELSDRDKGGNRFFHVRKEICGFADKHWDTICRGRTRTPTWWATLNAQITTRTDLFETVQHGSGKWALVYSNISSRKGSSPGSPTGDSKSSDTKLSSQRPLATSDSALVRRPRVSADSGDESSIKESDVDSESNGVSKSPIKRRRPRKKADISSESSVPAPAEPKRRPGNLHLDLETQFVDFGDLDPSCAQSIIARIERSVTETVVQSAHHPTHTSSLANFSPSDDVMDLVGYDADSATLFSDSASSDIFSMSSSSSSSSSSMNDGRNGIVHGSSTRRRVVSSACLLRMVPKIPSTSSSATTTPTENPADMNEPPAPLAPTPSQPYLVWTNVPIPTASEELSSLFGIFEASHTFRIPLSDEVLRSAAAYIPSLALQMGLPVPDPVASTPAEPTLRSPTPIPRSATPTPTPRATTPVPRAATPVPRPSTPSPAPKAKTDAAPASESKKKASADAPASVTSPNKGTRSSTGATPLRKTTSILPPTPSAPAEDALNKSVDSESSPTKRIKKRKIQALSRSMELSPSGSGWTSGSSTGPGAGGPRVTIKDLLDSGMINIEEPLLFRNQGDPGIVQDDGSIRWRGETFYSPSTFAKTAAKTLNLTSQGSFHNGWQYVYARGSPLTVLRDKYMAAHAPPVDALPHATEVASPPSKRHRPNSHVLTPPVGVATLPQLTELPAPLPPLKIDTTGVTATASPFDSTEHANHGSRFVLEEVAAHGAPFMFHPLHPPVNPHVPVSPSIIPQQPNFASLAAFNELSEVEPIRSMDTNFEQNMELV
eukprot:TRINITY_DN1036_c0_g1_i1.p1 TRINITY_DN1036_c0_g1~~TRINITY_DN1036_c0_g1_i1.p1  ORF type:complete len:867 (+),score=81.86 TRINITY_DN1036_c0_g1_i1:83-2602(+)